MLMTAVTQIKRPVLKNTFNQKGFSLVEVVFVLMLVIVILLLVAIVVGKITRSKRNHERHKDIETIAAAINHYSSSNFSSMPKLDDLTDDSSKFAYSDFQLTAYRHNTIETPEDCVYKPTDQTFFIPANHCVIEQAVRLPDNSAYHIWIGYKCKTNESNLIEDDSLTNYRETNFKRTSKSSYMIVYNVEDSENEGRSLNNNGYRCLNG